MSFARNMFAAAALSGVVAAFPVAASARLPTGCVFGDNSLPGSIGPGQLDNSRSYTIDGEAILTVSGAMDEAGRPVDLRVRFPGHCRQRSGPTISCTVWTDQVVKAVIKNPSSQRVTYRWVCTSL